MGRFEATMGGNNSDYKLVLYTSNDGTDVTAQLYWRRAGSTGYSSWNGAASFNIVIGGVTVASGTYNFNAPAGGAIGETWISGGVRDVGAVGSVSASGSFYTDTSDAGAGTVYGSQSVATVPDAPSNMAGTPDQITATSMRYRYRGNSDGGSPVIRWEYQYSTSSSFSGASIQVGTMSGDVVRTDLAPNTTYYWRARGVNAIGAGPWSSRVQGTTLTATAPTLTVTAAVNGTSASVLGTPSADMPTVDKWTYERRVQGTTTPVATETFTTNPYTVTGLAQGTIYEWRLSAWRGSYQSPWTAWQAVQQPNPNTNPGSYYDGSTAATGDATFSWGGTANNSTSKATGVDVRGWSMSGSGAVLSRQVGGHSRTYAARLTVLVDATAAGQLVVQQASGSRSAIAEGGTYNGTMYVQIPGRGQSIAAFIQWFNAGGSLLSTTTGTAVNQAANPGDWARIAVKGTAPAGAVTASLGITDVTGTGWSVWRSGDVMAIDDAMLSLGLYPYFDGDTPDDTDFQYDWMGDVDASVSTATVVVGGGSDPLADPDCPPPPAPPRPPIIEDECIDEVGTWRRYWAVVPSPNIAKWLANVPTITLESGTYATRQARIRLWENPDNLLPDAFIGSQDWVSEQIISYIPPGAIFVLDGVSESARATVGGQTVRADHLLFGSGGGPATWPLMRCGIAYLMSIDVPLDAPAGNLNVDVALTTRF